MTDMRWRGHKHETLYNWVNSGDGARAATPQLEYWEGLHRSLGDIGRRLSDSLNKIGASWEGQAGQSAQRGLTPMHQWAESAQQAAHMMRQSAQDQADHISTARAKMPEPVQKPGGGASSWPQEGANPPGHGKPANPAAAVAAHGKDFEGVERAAADSSERAVQVMNQYQGASEHNAGTLAQFSAPPDIQLEVGDKVISGGGAVGGGRSRPPRPQHHEAPSEAAKTPTEQAAAFTPNHPTGTGSSPHAQPHAEQPAAASSPSYTEGAASTMGASAAAGAVGGQLAPRLRPGGFSGATPGGGGTNRGGERRRPQRASQPVQSGGNTDAATNASSANPVQSGPGQQGHAGGTPMPPGGAGGGAGGFNSGDVTRGANPYLANRGLAGGSPDVRGFDPLGEVPAEGGHTGATAQPETGTYSETGAQSGGQHPGHPHAGGGYGAPELGGHGGAGGMPPAGPAGGGAPAGDAGGEEVHQNSFLVQADNIFDDEAIHVAPPVIGEDH